VSAELPATSSVGGGATPDYGTEDGHVHAVGPKQSGKRLRLQRHAAVRRRRRTEQQHLHLGASTAALWVVAGAGDDARRINCRPLRNSVPISCAV